MSLEEGPKSNQTDELQESPEADSFRGLVKLGADSSGNAGAPVDLRLYSESENQAIDAGKSRTNQGKLSEIPLTLFPALDSTA